MFEGKDIRTISNLKTLQSNVLTEQQHTLKKSEVLLRKDITVQDTSCPRDT